MLSQNASIVVTGGAGFIGSGLIKKLLSLGYENIFSVDKNDAFQNRPCTSSFRHKIKNIEVDFFLKNLSSYNLSHIFHMGACSSTTESNQDFLLQNNIQYSQTLWTHASQNKIPFYYASSAATYGAGENGYSDADNITPLLKALNLYGWSKIEFDKWVLTQSHKPPHWAGFRFFNVFGPGEEHKGPQSSVVWQAREQFLKNGFVKLFKSYKEGVPDGEQKRDFVFVDDVIECMLFFFHQKGPSGIYNVGSGQARSFNDLVKATAQALKVPLKIEYVEKPLQIREHYQYWTQADLRKLESAGYNRKWTHLEDACLKYMGVYSNEKI